MGLFNNENTCCQCREQLKADEDLLCSDCEQLAEEKARQLEVESSKKSDACKIARWDKICPAGYKRVEVGKMPDKLLEVYQQWNPASPESLYIKGASRIGKTSAAFLFGKAAHFEGLKVGYWQASDLRQKAIDAASGNDRFSQFKRDFLDADFIILDDFGNTAKTASSDEHLLSLLEGVRAKGIKTIITTQYHGLELVESFHNPTIGMAICNRAQQGIRVDLFPTK